jgi:hypothetical protein
MPATLPSTAVSRRKLRFASLDEALAEVDRLVEAARAGQIAYAGRWSLPTMLNHLAVWAEFAYTGVPTRIPLLVRLLARLFKRHFLYGSMPAGRRLPRVTGGTFGIEEVPLDKALRRLQIALLRLKNDPPLQPHPIFGRMTHTEWMALHMRHAELHLSFAVPAASNPRASSRPA